MLEVLANKHAAGALNYDADKHEYVFNYTENNPISLTMPYTSKSYLSSYQIHPIFDMNMPEGYLFELFKNLLIKEYGELNDYILFKHLSRTMEGYLTYDDHLKKGDLPKFALDEVLHNEDTGLFAKLVQMFLDQSAISGVQPKVLAHLEDRLTLTDKAYIIKSFSEEYPHLAENEYFCMKALTYAGIPVASFWLSDNKKLFVMEKFTYEKANDSFYGFEEFCVLFALNKDSKYSGSYEKIAKSITKISTQKEEDLKIFFKLLVMNNLLKNGDAHLKNFGMLYTSDLGKRFLSPAYDVVNTCIYLPKDKPALTMFGKKVWTSKNELLKFGQMYCLLNESESKEAFHTCSEALITLRAEIKDYIGSHNDFVDFGKKFISIIDFSLNENIDKEYKDISDGIL